MVEQESQNNSISGFQGYSDNDIDIVLKRIYEETLENRKKALDVYDKIVEKMNESDSSLAIMGSYAQNYLDVATKQTSELVKLAAVQQRLKATKILKDNPGSTDTAMLFQQVITQLDNNKTIIPLKDVAEKDMNYKDKNQIRDTKFEIIEEKKIEIGKDIIQDTNNLKGLSDLNIDELERNI